jgi:hypothetical protein
METITATQMAEMMKDVPMDSIVFVGYLAGRPSGPQGIKEASFAREQGINLTHYTGQFKGIRVTKKGEPVMTLWVEERDSASGPGAYRAFNPALGTLRTLEVIKRAAPQEQQATA